MHAPAPDLATFGAKADVAVTRLEGKVKVEGYSFITSSSALSIHAAWCSLLERQGCQANSMVTRLEGKRVDEAMRSCTHAIMNTVGCCQAHGMVTRLEGERVDEAMRSCTHAIMNTVGRRGHAVLHARNQEHSTVLHACNHEHSGAVIFPDRVRGHPGPTGFQSHHTKIPYITLYTGFYCGSINRRADRGVRTRTGFT